MSNLTPTTVGPMDFALMGSGYDLHTASLETPALSILARDLQVSADYKGSSATSNQSVTGSGSKGFMNKVLGKLFKKSFKSSSSSSSSSKEVYKQRKISMQTGFLSMDLDLDNEYIALRLPTSLDIVGQSSLPTLKTVMNKGRQYRTFNSSSATAKSVAKYRLGVIDKRALTKKLHDKAKTSDQWLKEKHSLELTYARMSGHM